MDDVPATVKFAAKLRHNSHPDIHIASVTSNASFMGSGISDLRATVCVQQKLLDGMVDKVAALLSAMHAEVQSEVRTTCERDTVEMTAHVEQELARSTCILEGRIADNQTKQLEWLKNQTLNIKEELATEAKTLYDRVVSQTSSETECVIADLHGMVEVTNTELRDSMDNLWVEARSQHATLADQIRTILPRVDQLESSAQHSLEFQNGLELSMGLRCTSLHEDIDDKLFEESTRVFETLQKIEEELTEQRNKSSADRCTLKQTSCRLDEVCVGLQRCTFALDSVEVGLRNAQQATAPNLEADAHASDWRHRVEDRLGNLVTTDARLGNLEDWRRRTDERIERMPAKVDALREQVGDLREQMDTSLSSMGRECKRLALWMEEATKKTNSEESDNRLVGQRLQEFDILNSRVHAAEKAVFSTQRQVDGLVGDRTNASNTNASKPDAAFDVEVRLSQMEGNIHRLTEDVNKKVNRALLAAQQQLRQSVEECIAQQLKSIDRSTQPNELKLYQDDMQNTVGDAVAGLGRRLEDDLKDRLVRCDAAAAGCELCARLLEDRMRLITDDIQQQLASDGGRLLDGIVGADAPEPNGISEVPEAAPCIISKKSSRRGETSTNSSYNTDQACESMSVFDLTFQPKSPSGLLAALSGKVAQQESILGRLQRENLALRSSALQP